MVITNFLSLFLLFLIVCPAFLILQCCRASLATSETNFWAARDTSLNRSKVTRDKVCQAKFEWQKDDNLFSNFDENIFTQTLEVSSSNSKQG